MDDAEWMAAVKERYVFKYYGHLKTEHERLAHSHLIATLKAEGSIEQEVQTEEERIEVYLRAMERFHKWFSDDPSVLLLVRDGYAAFIVRTGRRILQDHAGKIEFNCCPRCGGVARTPTARQCRFCFHDWHEAVQPSDDKSPVTS